MRIIKIGKLLQRKLLLKTQMMKMSIPSQTALIQRIPVLILGWILVMLGSAEAPLADQGLFVFIA